MIDGHKADVAANAGPSEGSLLASLVRIGDLTHRAIDAVCAVDQPVEPRAWGPTVEPMTAAQAREIAERTMLEVYEISAMLHGGGAKYRTLT